MFFSDDLLTSKKGSFGIIWLMATLGPRGKKISRKQLSGVDLAKTCDLIAEPPEPMALRLSGCLLVGVARVYNQNIEIFYSDVTNFHSTLRRSITTDFVTTESGSGGVANTVGMNLPGGGRSRPELITYGGIDFELGLDYEFSHIDWNNPLGTHRKRRASSLLSSQQTQSSKNGEDEDEEEDGEEDLESEMGREFKRNRLTSSPAATGNSTTRARMTIHHPSDRTNPNLYSVFDVPYGETVDLDLQFEGEAIGVGNESFSGPSGRDFDMPAEGAEAVGAFGEALEVSGIGGIPPGSRAGSVVPSQAARSVEGGTKVPSSRDSPDVIEGLESSQNHAMEEAEEAAHAPQKRARKVKTVKFDANLELAQEEDLDARKRYRADMERGHREGQMRDQEKRVNAQIQAMLETGGGGFEFLDPDMNAFIADYTKVGKFKWELDVGAMRQQEPILDREEENRRPGYDEEGLPPQPLEHEVFGLAGMEDGRMMQGFEPAYQDGYQDFEVPVRGSSRRHGSEVTDLEYARRASQQSQQGPLPWEDQRSAAREFTPGFGEAGDTSFSSPSLRLSIMTPQEARLRLNSRTGSGKDSAPIQRHGRYRSSSLISDRPDDDPLLLTTAGAGELELPLDEPLNIGTLGASQQERLRDLPAAFRPEMLATLEKQCRDFFSYVERKMITLDEEKIEFEELVPAHKSNKHVAALAFYDCLTLATKKILSVSQPEPWEAIKVRFAVANV